MNDEYFALFQLKPGFDIDLTQLETNYRNIQSATHPDRFVNASSAEKLASMHSATLANEAYLTLKNPANRAKYFLALQGIDAVKETNTHMPTDFLMQQMEWREAMDDAKSARDTKALEQLLSEIKQAGVSLQTQLICFIDDKKDFVAATDATRKLIFMDKVCADIHKIIEIIE